MRLAAEPDFAFGKSLSGESNLIARIWKGYMASDDPQFEQKAAAIIGLCRNDSKLHAENDLHLPRSLDQRRKRRKPG